MGGLRPSKNPYINTTTEENMMESCKKKFKAIAQKLPRSCPEAAQKLPRSLIL